MDSSKYTLISVAGLGWNFASIMDLLALSHVTRGPPTPISMVMSFR